MTNLKYKKLKVKETVPATQYYNIFAKAALGGIFTLMFQGDEVWSRYNSNMCFDYYYTHSGDKIVSPTYTAIVDLLKKNDTSKTDDEVFTEVNNSIASRIIRPKFLDKWTRVYTALVTEQYNPLDDYSEVEIKEGNDTDTTTYDLVDGKTGQNKDVITHDVTTEDNGKTGTSETTTRYGEKAADVYGFNSTTPAGDTFDTDNNTETVVGEPDKNTSQNIQTKTGTESKALDINEEYTKKGTETKTFGVSETKSRNGRHTTGAELVEAELNLRNKQIFFDIVFKDIDSIIALQIY